MANTKPCGNWCTHARATHSRPSLPRSSSVRLPSYTAVSTYACVRSCNFPCRAIRPTKTRRSTVHYAPMANTKPHGNWFTHARATHCTRRLSRSGCVCLPRYTAVSTYACVRSCNFPCRAIRATKTRRSTVHYAPMANTKPHGNWRTHARAASSARRRSRTV